MGMIDIAIRNRGQTSLVKCVSVRSDLPIDKQPQPTARHADPCVPPCVRMSNCDTHSTMTQTASCCCCFVNLVSPPSPILSVNVSVISADRWIWQPYRPLLPPICKRDTFVTRLGSIRRELFRGTKMSVVRSPLSECANKQLRASLFDCTA